MRTAALLFASKNIGNSRAREFRNVAYILMQELDEKMARPSELT